MSDKIDLELLKTKRITQLKSLNSQALSNRYKLEDLTTDAIRAGDLEELDAALENLDLDKLLDGLEDAEQGNLLRNYKNLLFSINTYCRIAAKNGEVLPLYLHLVSERYTSLIESATSVDFLNKNVFYAIYYDYCNAVNQFSTKNYSDVMTEIVRYITNNLTSNLTLKDIAEEYDMHPVHLARKFKQETGITFIGYVNQQRIFLAKYYFRLQKYQLSEVAYLSGYNSHSYFTKVFKKLTGDTPTKYIRRISTTQ